MKSTDNISDLAAALSKAQSAMRTAEKDATNPHFKSDYATLASVWDACRDPLAANGLSVMQPVEQDEHGVIVTTRLAHASGQWVESSLAMPLEKRTAQAVGSAITYGRRYGLAAMVGVCADDDDGNAAEEAAPAKRRADAIAKQHGMQTADKLPELTDAERAYVNDATGQIAAADSLEVLETIKAFLGDKPEHVKAKLRGLWAAKKKEIEGRVAA